MILSPSNRTKYTEEFKALSQTVQGLVLNAGILLKSADNKFVASAVAFYAAYGTAYVITAKHNLWVQAGNTVRPAGTPSSLKAGFTGTAEAPNVQMYYGATAIGGTPGTAAPITDIHFTAGDSWGYDAMVLETTADGMVNHITTNGFIKKNSDAQSNLDALKFTVGGEGAPALKKESNTFVQIGFGHWKDAKDLPHTKDWEDHPGQLQCRVVQPKATEPAATVYNVPAGTAKKDWEKQPSLTDQLLVAAGNNDSTGPGDSGGPLFSTPSGTTGSYIRLVGTTFGANVMDDIETPTKAPVNNVLENNASTYMLALFKESIGSIPH